jgi:polyhydroxyalkanoate synthesis regulator phasin
MSERTKLLKKAVLTSVGASVSSDRIKDALKAAMDDLVKVGQDLFEDLESEGKLKTDNMQTMVKNLNKDARQKTGEIEKMLSSSMKKAIKEMGLITREDIQEVLERINDLEELVIAGDDENNPRKKPNKKGRNS